MEMTTIGGRRQGLRQGINWMVFLGAGFAVLAAVLGWFLKSFDDYSGDLVQLHQYLGITTSTLAVLSAILLQLALKGNLSNLLPYRITLTLSVVLLTIASHMGATLTHGEGFLTEAFEDYGFDAEDNSQVLLAELRSADTLSEPQLDQLNLGVRAIFAHNCYQCHSENKQKGKLVLENKRGVFRGGESGTIITPGEPLESELFRRISLPVNHDEVMPKKGKILKSNQISLIKLWIEKGAHWADRSLQVFPEAPLALSKPTLLNSENDTHPINSLISQYFKEHNTSQPSIVDDHTFIRRSYLDIVGLLPSPEMVAAFVKDQDLNKREKLIDQLLDDEHNYTQHWLSFWNDLLRNDYSGTGFITGGRKQITDWLYSSLMVNKPYDQMVTELVNPSEASEGFIKGIKWRGVVNSSQSTEMQAAQNISQSLMGMNLKCASCHNSFVSNLTLEQAYGFASIFADSVLELNRCDQPLGRMAKSEFLYTELGSVEAETIKERLLKLSQVMVKPENGRLYRTITNRIWKRLIGRGMVEPADEMDRTSWSPELLDWLAADFVESGYDLKLLIRTIMTSKAYQMPTESYGEKSEILSDKYVFSGPVVRRLSAEQFSDAVSQVVAPVYHATAYSPEEEEFSYGRIWHREIKFERDVLPEPGDRYFRYRFELPEEEIENARLLISVDDSYILYFNGNQVLQGNDWRKVGDLDLTEMAMNGNNIIAIKGSNEGTLANPAGILVAFRVIYKSGKEVLISSDKNWKSTDEAPEGDWTALDFEDSEWPNARNYGSKHWDKLVDLTFKNKKMHFARASLVRQHQFMKALGRPSRENVATTRDDQATLLQALELTNGDFFNNVLADGAEQMLQDHGSNGQKIAFELYQKSFAREPSKKELQLILEMLGNAPDKDAVQDVIWATVLSPEFQFIY